MAKRRFNDPDIDSSLEKGEEHDRELHKVNRVVENAVNDDTWGGRKLGVGDEDFDTPWWKISNGKTPPGKRKKR